MTTDPFDFKLPFLARARSNSVSIHIVQKSRFETVRRKLGKAISAQAEHIGFEADSGQILYDEGKNILFYAASPESIFDFSKLNQKIQRYFSSNFLKNASFEIDSTGLKKDDLEALFLGWGMHSYRFKITQKKSDIVQPALLWHKDVDKKRITSLLESIYLLRNLVNIPAISMGPDELEAATKQLAESYKAKFKVIKGKVLEKGFPLIHAVGMASHRAPRLLELNWGKAKDPKICIVGKGVCFDTGGLDLKPSQYMRLMKKDMGGAAHALALARVIMVLNLPVRIQLLIPAVENAVAAESFRPGDIFTSRQGLTVENTNTDAEGRLILADSLTYGCEDKPELLIDYATLTGSARAALGQDIPAMFSNVDKIAAALQKTSINADDPLWAMPLWEGYNSLIESSVADLHNSAGVPGDLIYSALFLQKFLLHDTPWVHIDTFAWESNGRPGRAKGAMDMGLRSVFAYLEQEYGTKN